MPALPPVAATLRIAINALDGDATVANIFHAQYSGTAPTNAQLDTFAASVHSAWNTSIVAGLASTYVLQDVQVTDLTSSTSAVGEHIGVIAGGGSGTGNPNAVALVWSHKIARRYRGGHPRTYLAGTLSSWLANGYQWSSSIVANLATDFAAFQTAVQAAGWSGAGSITMGSVSYRSGGAPRVTPIFDVFLKTAVQPRVCNQRRRLGPLIVE